MPGIVCAIRGGPASKPTISTAIKLALTEGQPIYFLFIVNLDFLLMTSSSKVHIVSQEMSEMGEFILLTRQAKAESAGAKAFGGVRHGEVQEQIIAQCEEVVAEYVVLGRPRATELDNANVFTNDSLNHFRIAIESLIERKVVFIGVLVLIATGFLHNTLAALVGASMGGNGSLIGASANMVTVGIAERAGYPISYVYFFKKGFPAMIITLAFATVWLLIWF